MTEFEDLVEKVRATKFSCQHCAECCSGANNEVMVTPDEVFKLMEATGLEFLDIAEPYPEWMEFPDGTKITFGWVLKRGVDGNCMFLEKNHCRVYKNRPHICKTYPFMLTSDGLIVSECRAVGCSAIDCSVNDWSDVEETENNIDEAADDSAEKIASYLLTRRDAEDKEFRETEVQYQKNSIASGSTVIIDSLGVHQKK